MSETELNTWK